MPFFVPEAEEPRANDPKSLEGRLLFAVPKSKSTYNSATMLTDLTIQLQREDYYKQL
jgi:hypothetical protein